MKVLSITGATMILVSAGLAAQPRSAQPPLEPTRRPEVRVSDCTAGGCHAGEVEFRFLHAPAALGACDTCHIYEDVRRHTFSLKHSGAAMCDFCHIGKSVPGNPDSWQRRPDGQAGPVHVHDPVLAGDCTACHNPHGSNIRRLINADSLGQLCLSCHKDVASHSHNHTPVAQGDCLDCHQPHSSMHRGLLIEQGRDLCVRCHKDTVSTPAPHLPAPLLDGDMRALAGILASMNTRAGLPPYIHEPVLQDCTTCHDHHGTAHASLLKQDTVSLCGSCHEGVKNTVRDAHVQHSAVTSDRACLNCHSPHQSMHTQLLRSRPIEMCLDCHSKDITRPDGRVIGGMASTLQGGQHLHGPLAEGQCRGCHQVHGSSQANLLSAPYSDALYQRFSESAYALCFSCHSPDLVREAKTTTATRFRDGDQNLHYVHIAAQDASGRSCRLCHAPHAGQSHPRLLDKVTFGQWVMSLEYKATETGGTCSAGCHRAREYSRERGDSDAGPGESVRR